MVSAIKVVESLAQIGLGFRGGRPGGGFQQGPPAEVLGGNEICPCILQAYKFY